MLHLNILINLILKTYFTHSNCLLIFNNNQKIDYHPNQTLPVVILNVSDQIEEEITFNYYGCQGILIFSDSPRRIFEEFENLIRLHLERFNYRRYLIVSDEIEDIFNSTSLKFVSDFLIVRFVRLNEEIFEFYTHKYVGFDDNNEIIKVDEWFSKNFSFLNNNNLYPDKLKNQMGRNLKLATFTYAPYSIPDNFDGTEVFICLEFSKKYNLTPKFIIDEDGEWGDVYDNWTGYGVVGNLATDRGDIGLGALYIWERVYYFLDISKPALRSGITCLAPAPKVIGGWITPFISFSWKMWLMTFCSFLISHLAIFFAITIDKLKDKSKRSDKINDLIKSFMLTQAVFLLQGLSKIPIKARSIFVLILLLSFYVATLYSTELASNMAVPRYVGMIKNVHDLAEQDIKWGATSVAWVSALFDDTNPVYKKVVNNFLGLSYQDLYKNNEENFGFAVERLSGGCLAIGNYITKEGIQKRRLMDEDVDWEHCVMILRKNSILLPKFDQLILEISQAGLLYIWEYKITVRTSDMKLQKAVRLTLHPTHHDKTKLTLTHLEGAFALWFVGITISTLIFIMELRRFKKSNK